MKDLIIQTPLLLRILGWGCWVVALLMVLTLFLQLGSVVAGDREPLPNYNIVERIAESATWFYVGALHLVLADYREKSK